MILLGKKINVDKNETESKRKNPIPCFRKTNYALRPIKKLEIKCKTMISWSSQKKKKVIFCTIYFV